MHSGHFGMAGRQRGHPRFSAGPARGRILLGRRFNIQKEVAKLHSQDPHIVVFNASTREHRRRALCKINQS